jgi:hypothetical protein
VRATEVTGAEKLAIVASVIMREILRDDEPTPEPVALNPAPQGPPPPPEPQDNGTGWAQTQLDFDQSNDVCEHNGVWIPRESCPEHGLGADIVPTIEELDDMESEDVSGPIQRARRIAENKAKREAKQRLFPEDLPMRGMGPPPGDDE